MIPSPALPHPTHSYWSAYSLKDIDEQLIQHDSPQTRSREKEKKKSEICTGVPNHWAADQYQAMDHVTTQENMLTQPV